MAKEIQGIPESNQIEKTSGKLFFFFRLQKLFCIYSYPADRKAAINFFSTVGGSRFVGGVSGSHPSSNTNGNKDARLQAILSTLEKNRFVWF